MPNEPHTQLEPFDRSEFLTELCIEGLGLQPSSAELKPIARSLITLVRYHEQRSAAQDEESR